MSAPEAASVAHVTRVTSGYGQFRVECLRCPFWEFYEDATTAHREAQRHEITSRVASSVGDAP